MGFMGNFSMSFPESCVNSLNEFLEAGKCVQLVVVDHIVFDSFGESVVSLTTECCIAPLNTCG